MSRLKQKKFTENPKRHTELTGVQLKEIKEKKFEEMIKPKNERKTIDDLCKWVQERKQL